jgi:hypothetical protein
MGGGSMLTSYPRGRRLAIVSRSLFIYLLSTWLLVRYFGPGESGIGRSLLPGIAIVAGFPIVILMAMRLAHRRIAGYEGIWVPIVAAAGTAILLPVACLQIHESPPPSVVDSVSSSMQSTILTDAAAPAPVQARVLAEAHAAGAADGLRLRIRGLSVDYPGVASEPGGPAAAEILLNTSVREGTPSDELVITVSLVEKENNRVIWTRDYVGDPSDFVAIRRLIIKALSEAMGQTREGLSGGQFV